MEGSRIGNREGGRKGEDGRVKPRGRGIGGIRRNLDH